MTPENRFHYCKLNNRSKTMLIILLLVWDFNPMSSLHFLFLCVKDPAARSEGILCSVFTTWRTSHALSHWQGQDWQALHPRWQEVWHPVAGQHNYSGYFHTSLFIRIFSDYFLHFFMYFFIHGPLSFFTIFYKCHPTTSQSLAHFNLISNEKNKSFCSVQCLICKFPFFTTVGWALFIQARWPFGSTERDLSKTWWRNW